MYNIGVPVAFDRSPPSVFALKLHFKLTLIETSLVFFKDEPLNIMMLVISKSSIVLQLVVSFAI